MIGHRGAAALTLAIVGWLAAVPSEAMPLCSALDERITCVIDGDTVRVDGEIIRLADIDAPEMGSSCLAENFLAMKATERLSQILADGDYLIHRGDPSDGRMQDRFGRTLAVIEVKEESVGILLIAENLAAPWVGKKVRWC